MQASSPVGKPSAIPLSKATWKAGRLKKRKERIFSENEEVRPAPSVEQLESELEYLQGKINSFPVGSDDYAAYKRSYEATEYRLKLRRAS